MKSTGNLTKTTKPSKKAHNKPKGLGDTIEKITKATGIKKVVDKVFDTLGKDCGCDERKEKLNKLFPYKQPDCLQENEYEILKEFFKFNRATVTAAQQRDLLKIHNRIFPKKRNPTGCGSCVRELVDIMNKVYKEY
jgi:NAD(P)H-nitrite reductase large subunit